MGDPVGDNDTGLAVEDEVVGFAEVGTGVAGFDEVASQGGGGSHPPSFVVFLVDCCLRCRQGNHRLRHVVAISLVYVLVYVMGRKSKCDPLARGCMSALLASSLT